MAWTKAIGLSGVVTVCMAGALAMAPSTQPAATDPTAVDASATDPRPGLQVYFAAIRRGDEAAAFACWCNDVSADDRQVSASDLARHSVADMAATARFEAVLARQLPAVFDERRRTHRTLPTAEQLAAAQFTVYRRLALVRWGPDEDDVFPMVLDNSDLQHPVWRLSMQQWRETTRSSVGDPMLLSGIDAKAADATAADPLAGRLQTGDEVDAATLKRLGEAADALDKGDARAARAVHDRAMTRP